MRSKIYLSLFALFAFVNFSKAQHDFQQADSTSASLLNSSNWAELIAYGKNAIAKGEDYPMLRLKIGYAAFVLEKYSLALQQYDEVLKNDSYNQTALYYAYFCNIYLNRPKEASYLASKIDKNVIQEIIIKPVAVTLVGAETSIKFTDCLNDGRNSNFSRAYVQIRTGHKAHVDYSIAAFNQDFMGSKLSEIGSHIKFTYMPIKYVSVLSSWNYSRAKYSGNNYDLNALLIGLRYTKPFYNIQGDFSATKNSNTNTYQGTLQIMTYLSGNLDFYLCNRMSYLSTTGLNSFIYQPIIGIKAAQNIWAEAGGAFGTQYNYMEADGLYQYNGFDRTDYKLVTNTYFLLKKHLLLRVGYTFECKKDLNLDINYKQYSINAGTSWNF